MTNLFTASKKVLRHILLWCVAANLVLASIPRCDMILATLHLTLLPQEAMENDHCAKMVKTDGAAIGTYKLCACGLAKLVFGQASNIKHDPIVTRQPQPISTLNFTYIFSASQHIVSLDTPPPRIA